MKLHFEDNLDYQKTAIEAVVNLFCGQDINRTEFTVSKLVDPTGQLKLAGMEESTLGIGNRLQLLDDELLENLKNIQLRNGLRPSDSLASGDFTVEMETGTGKIYVYLRTIFELNKRYGFTKFMIVMPSVAIKEGTYKTLQITRDHFENLYPNAKGYEYFLYDSRKLGQVRNYATSPNIQIMVVTVGAINKKDVNNLYKDSEKTGGEKPIDLVRATNSIIIVDEPLTRRSFVEILTQSRRLNDFKRNPQQFIDLATEAINRTKRLALVDGIRYQRIGDDHYYAQELFEKEELTGYLKNTLETQKSVYQHVVYDSAGVERRFAEDLEANEAVKVYAKLPGWFKVPTPLGTYNPDWAVLVEIDGQEKLYFVVETKGSNWWDDLRHREGAKIKCGEKHFAELAVGENPAQYIKATSVDDMMRHG